VVGVIVWNIVRRALDVREARAARQRAEEAYRHVLGVLAGQTRDRSEVDDGDLLAADARIAALDEQLRNALKAHREVLDRCAALEKQLDEYARKNATAHTIAAGHREVSKLPPALTRDREALSRLEDENARLRDALAEAQRHAVELEKQLEGNPS
jgi:hypothetical protein